MHTRQLNFIDAHHHLWDLQACDYPWLMAKGVRRFFGDPTPIQQNYLANDFLKESSEYRPLASVHIQVGASEDHSLTETKWLQQQDEYPHAIVAFADLSARDLEAQLEQQLYFKRVKGIRQILGRHIEEDRLHGSAALLENPQWVNGLRQLAKHGLTFDLQLIPPQIDSILEILKLIPELKVALCHCGSPWDQTTEGLAYWRNRLQKLAELPNCYCKVSGLGMFNPSWQEASLMPLIETVIELFSPQRVMFGSNFPVDKLYRSYEDLWRCYETATNSYSAKEKNQMFVHSAAEFYRIVLPQTATERMNS